MLTLLLVISNSTKLIWVYVFLFSFNFYRIFLYRKPEMKLTMQPIWLTLEEELISPLLPSNREINVCYKCINVLYFYVWFKINTLNSQTIRPASNKIPFAKITEVKEFIENITKIIKVSHRLNLSPVMLVAMKNRSKWLSFLPLT